MPEPSSVAHWHAAPVPRLQDAGMHHGGCWSPTGFPLLFTIATPQPHLNEVLPAVLAALESNHLGGALRVAAQASQVDAAEGALRRQAGRAKQHSSWQSDRTDIGMGNGWRRGEVTTYNLPSTPLRCCMSLSMLMLGSTPSPSQAQRAGPPHPFGTGCRSRAPVQGGHRKWKHARSVYGVQPRKLGWKLVDCGDAAMHSRRP